MRLCLALCAALLAALVGAPAAAAAAEPIEGSWLYNGGEVLIEPTGPGTFKGTVVKPTQFANCLHPIGQRMWEIAGAGVDYTGSHDYYFNSTCAINPDGQAAWKVVSTDPASFRLRFCSVPPGQGPPTFDAAGEPTGATIPCDELTRSLPPQAPPTFADIANLPKASKRCRSRRNFSIRLRAPKADPLVRATVAVNGKQVKVIVGVRLRAPVNLRGLPKGRYVVKIVATTASGRAIQGTRRYRTCAPKRR